MIVAGSNAGGAHSLLGTQDLHVHTTMSDGDLGIEAVVAIAAERGITVGIADHVSRRNMDFFVSNGERLEAYLAAIEQAPVLRSAELCWCDAFSTEIAFTLRDRFDYLIGSNHGFALPDGGFVTPWSRTLPTDWGARPQDVMEIMVHNLCDMVSTLPISIAAHSTLVPPALLAIEPDVHAWWTEEREARFIDAARSNGVAIEISNRYRLPHDRFLEHARQVGARFSLGSDGHQVHQVAELDWAIGTAIRADIGDAQLFIPRRG